MLISIKDHKETFPNKILCRLINPAKSDIGKIGKSVLDRINRILLTEINVNQWKNTDSVIKWFQEISEKNSCSFIVFDIESFYPSISETLFNNAINFAKMYTQVTAEDLQIILQARKTLLFYETNTWVKKLGNEDFDVPMGCFDGAEICELAGIFLLTKLKDIVNIDDIGLYRDDGLGVLKNLSGPMIDRKRKDIIKLFKEHGLSITIETNIKIVNYLDIK